MALIKTENINTLSSEEDEMFFIDDNNKADFVICKSPHKLKKLIDALQHSNNIHYISDGDWSMHDLVIELLKQMPQSTLYITTYALREFPVRQLILAMERKDIAHVNMLIDYRAKARTPEVYQLANMNFNRIYLTSVHAKVCVIENKTCSISIVGSANWTQNPRIEAGVISKEKHIAEFHINWIEKAINNGELFE